MEVKLEKVPDVRTMSDEEELASMEANLRKAISEEDSAKAKSRIMKLNLQSAFAFLAEEQPFACEPSNFLAETGKNQLLKLL